MEEEAQEEGEEPPVLEQQEPMVNCLREARVRVRFDACRGKKLRNSREKGQRPSNFNFYISLLDHYS